MSGPRLWTGLGALLAIAVAMPLAAQITPTPDRADPRLAAARFDGAVPVRLEVPVTSPVTVLLPAGTAPGAVNLTTPADWLVNVDSSGDSFSVRAVRPVPDAELAVVTPARKYRFVLTVTADPAFARVVRITMRRADRPKSGDRRGAAQRSAAAASAATATATYRLSGKRELWPSSIRDDGEKMYLEWAPDQALPAVFAVDRLGREEMVNGYMRGTVFTIDRVHDQLEFRIDKASAAARRKAGRAL